MCSGKRAVQSGWPNCSGIDCLCFIDKGIPALGFTRFWSLRYASMLKNSSLLGATMRRAMGLIPVLILNQIAVSEFSFSVAIASYGVWNMTMLSWSKYSTVGLEITQIVSDLMSNFWNGHSVQNKNLNSIQFLQANFDIWIRTVIFWLTPNFLCFYREIS